MVKSEKLCSRFSLPARFSVSCLNDVCAVRAHGYMLSLHLSLKWKHGLQTKKQQSGNLWILNNSRGFHALLCFCYCPLGESTPRHTQIVPTMHTHGEWERGRPSRETQTLHILLSLFIHPSIHPSSHLLLCINTTVSPAIPFHTLLSLCLAHTPQPFCALPPQYPWVSIKSTLFQ